MSSSFRPQSPPPRANGDHTVTNVEPSAPPDIPGYDLVRLIGRGSYGDVWLARGITGIHRAVKIVWRDRFSEIHPYEREFSGLREFATISLLEQRQLALLHVGRNDAQGFFYYVMELADDVETGTDIAPERYVPHTLREVQRRVGRRSATDVVTLGIQLAHALADLHSRGLVHRDIKPSNVIFVAGVAKLADIGLVSTVNSSQTFVGTEGFVPPEGSGTFAADVYSLGKLLYETATGLDRKDYPRLPPNLHELPDRKKLVELNEVLIRACEPTPARRYTAVSSLLRDLELLQAGRSLRWMRTAERWLGRSARAAAVVAVVAAVAGAGVLAERTRSAHKERIAEVNESRGTIGISVAEQDRGDPEPKIHALGASGYGLLFERELAGVGASICLWDFARRGEKKRWSLTLENTGAAWEIDRAVLSSNSRTCALTLIARAGKKTPSKLLVLDIDGDRPVLEEVLEYPVNTLSFSRDGTLLAVSEGPRAALHVLDVAEGRRR